MSGRRDDLTQLEDLLRSVENDLALPPAPDVRTGVRKRLNVLNAISQSGAISASSDEVPSGEPRAPGSECRPVTTVREKSLRRQLLEMAAAALVVVVFTGLLALVYQNQASRDDGTVPGVGDPTEEAVTDDPTDVVGDGIGSRIPAIAYSRDDDGESILVIVDIEGDVLHEIRDLPQLQYGFQRSRILAAVSPAGTHVVFEGGVSDRGNLYIREIPDGEDQPLVVESGIQDSNPAWSPDGEWIAFEREQNDHTEIYVIRPDGSDLRQLTETEEGAGVPVWSPDSQQIAFVSPPSWEALGFMLDANPAEVTLFAIHVVNVDGTGQRPIPGAEIFEPQMFAPSGDPGSAQAWSIDSRQIVFTVYEAHEDRDGASPRLAMADVEGESIEVIPDLFAFSPAWSPTGDKIAFAAQETSDSASIFLYAVDSGDVIHLVDYDDWLGNPQWSPDGEYLKYATDEGTFVVRADGGEPRLVAESADHASINTWVWARAGGERPAELPTQVPDEVSSETPASISEITPTPTPIPPAQLSATEDITIDIADDQMLALAAQRWVDDRRVMTVFDLDGNVLWEFNEIPNIELEGFPSTIVADVSPDGRHVVYQHNDDDGRSDIFAMDADGGEPRQLTTTGDSYRPVWSPDGEQIAFISSRADPADRERNHRGELFVMDWDGSNQQQLTDTPYGAGQARWSPDGSRIAVVSPGGSAGVHPINDGEVDQDLPIQLFVVDVSSGNQIHLEDASLDHVRRLGLAEQPWLTDGSALLLERQVGDLSEIIVAWADGRGVEVIEGVHEFQPGTDTPMTVSPDGRHVAFSRSDGSNSTLNMLDLETSEFVETAALAPTMYTSWSPDGSLLTRLGSGTIPDDYPDGLGYFELWVISPSDGTGDLVVEGVSGPAKWLVVPRDVSPAD